MIWIGLTGGIGSGKSQVAAAWAHDGVPVIDADAVSRSLTAQNGAALPAIREAFGDTVFSAHNQLDRAALRQRVFADADEKAKLEKLMFPLILAGVRREMAAVGEAEFGLIEIPLLAESRNFWPLIHRVLVVECSEQMRIERVQQRSGLSEKEVRQIMATQADDAQRRAIADDVLVNDGSLAQLQQKVRRLYAAYRAGGVVFGRMEKA